MSSEQKGKQQAPATERPKPIIIHDVPPISLKTQVQNVHRKIEEQVEDQFHKNNSGSLKLLHDFKI